ncbi:MAG: DNA-binding domain-containing protein [Azospirillaceae bacterium]
MLRDLQAAFREGVLSGREEAAHAFIEADGIDRAKRFSIYRLNTEISLAKALATCFPVVERLVGSDFFKAMARAFIARHPPARPQLLAYGDALPAFIADFPSAASVPYLADVARLEWARNEALFAADAGVLTASDLEAYPVERYGELHLRPHPSVRFVESAWPVLSIWRAHQHDPVAPFPRREQAEQALVLRPFLRVETEALSTGDMALLASLAGGASLADAAESAAAVEPGIDLMTVLAGHLRRGSFAAAALPDSDPETDSQTEK